MRICSVFSTVICLLAVGCTDPELETTAESPSEVVFARIDECTVTDALIKEQVLVDAKIEELRGRPIRPQKFNHWANGRAMKILGDWVMRVAYEQELTRLGVTTRDQIRQRQIAAIARKAKIKSRDEAEIFSRFGELEGAIRRRVDMAAKLDTYVESHADYTVSAADLEAYYTDISNRMVQAEAINRRAWVRGNEAWQELSKGADWEAVAQKYNQDQDIDEAHQDFWKDWIEADLANIQPVEVQPALKDQPAGYFTKPIETDEGLLIVKIFKREESWVSLGRILILMGEQLEMPERTAAEKWILSQKRRKIIQNLAEDVFNRYKFDYPMGQKFRYEIWKEEGEKNARTHRVGGAQRQLDQ